MNQPPDLQPLVIKIGGSTLGSTDTTFADIAAMARAGDVPVVVHGGGAEASQWLERMSIPSRFERGLRITDEHVLPVVVAVFAGLVNKRIVSAINAQGGVRAVGFSGADGRTVQCSLAAPEYGFVGNPVSVDPSTINALLAARIIPVISPIGCVIHQEGDQLVNINADAVAGSVAAAVDARSVVFLTDVDGVRGADEARLATLTGDEVAALLASGVINGGMIPKVEACLNAVSLGVPAQIIDGRQPHALAKLAGSGTLFPA